VERVPLPAPASGTLAGWWTAPGETVAEGDPVVVLTFEAEVDMASVVESPCRCTLVRRLAAAGETVSAGEDLALLVPEGASGFVEAVFDRTAAPEEGDPVLVDLPTTGARFDGVVETVGDPQDPEAVIGLPASLVTAVPANAVFARISTSPAIPAAAAGDLAVVTLRPES
jgi:pyruvate/2-oxoglutarate dehydrogenase complex dihydrolipoamide acyltransferase (E2) component